MKLTRGNIPLFVILVRFHALLKWFFFFFFIQKVFAVAILAFGIPRVRYVKILRLLGIIGQLIKTLKIVGGRKVGG